MGGGVCGPLRATIQEHKERSERGDLSHLWGGYQSYGVAMEGAAAEGFAMGVTPKASRRARGQGASSECWLCGWRGCDCEASEGSSAPVTPEQRTISMDQVTPERTGGAEREFSLGPAAIGEKSERVIGTQTTGTQTTEEPTAADKECTAVATDKGEIQEMKALMEELQAQVLRTERLAGMVDSWTVASPEVAVEGVNSAERYVQQKVSKKRMVRRLWKKADNLAVAAREATAEAEAAEAAEQMKVRAGEAAAVRRKGQSKAIRSKKAATAAAERAATVASTATAATSNTSVEERRAAMTGISAQSTQYSKSRNSTVTTAEMKKYRTKNRPWD